MDNNPDFGLQISEKEYRDLPYPSYSLLSDIKKNGVEVIDGERNEEIGEMDGVMIGKLVDNLYIENKFPENLHIINKKPSGKAKAILKALAVNKDKMPNKRSIFHKNNVSIINGICSKLEYYKASKKDSFDENAPAVIEKRLKGLKNYKAYYKLISTMENVDDNFIITSYLYNIALGMVAELNRFNNLTNINNNPNIDIISQLKITGNVSGITLKGMLDFVVIDHDKKEITPFDLKTGYYSKKDFIEKGFYGWNYYIQAALYYELLLQNMLKHSVYCNYKLNSFKFVYCGRSEKEAGVFTVPRESNFDLSVGFRDTSGNKHEGLNYYIEQYKSYIKEKNNPI